jgi:hypothetical protein
MWIPIRAVGLQASDVREISIDCESCKYILPWSMNPFGMIAATLEVPPVFMPAPKHLPRYFFRDTTKGTCRYGPHHPWVRVRELLHLNWRASQSVLQHLGDRIDVRLRWSRKHLPIRRESSTDPPDPNK